MGEVNIGDIWIVEAGISPRHDIHFAGAFETKDEAMAFADEIAVTLYPNVTIERDTTNAPFIEARYYHPDSVAGDNMFIVVSQNKATTREGVIDHFKGIEEINRMP